MQVVYRAALLSAALAFTLGQAPACPGAGRASNPPDSTDLKQASLAEIVKGIESHYRQVHTLKGQFTQTYSWGDNRKTESGVAYFARGGLMRWVYLEPKNKLVVSDGKTVWLYVPEDKQATRSEPKLNAETRVPFPLLVSHFKLRRIFSKIEFADQSLKADPGDRVLRGYPKTAYEDEYSDVLLEIGPSFELKRLVLHYPDHSVMQFDFAHMQSNVALRSELFQFNPPPGTQVIGE